MPGPAGQRVAHAAIIGRGEARLTRGSGIVLELALAVLTLGGCASVQSNGTGETTALHRFWPSGERWAEAARNALRDPVTWAPATAAVVIAAGGWDRSISDWAREQTPVFGSTQQALDASDHLRFASHVLMIGSALAVSAGEHRWQAAAERLIVEEGGVFLTRSTTEVIKSAAGRERPDGSDDRSFPSSHASRAFAYSAMTSRNVRSMTLPTWLDVGLRGTALTLAGATAWARVEGGAHYPTDVLAGAALGNLLAVIVHDAFLGSGGTISVQAELGHRSASFGVRLRY